MPILKGLRSNLTVKRKLRTEMTPAENKLWLQLKTRQFENLRFRRQHGIGPYIVDFYCPEKKIVIEVDGDIHALDGHDKKDQQRENWLMKLGLKVLRYKNDDVMNNLDNVLQDLYERTVLNSTPSDSPLQRGRGINYPPQRGRG